MQKIWDYTLYDKLHADPKDHPILLTEPPHNPKANREQMAEIMFENYSFPALYVANTSVLSLYELGRTTGIVLDSGDGFTCAVPIYEGHALPHAITGSGITARDINEYLIEKFSERGHYFNSLSERETVRDIKEKLCYVARDFEQEMNKEASSVQKSYELPDGEIITVGKERFICPEALFKPSLLSSEALGLHKMIHNSMMKCDIDILEDMKKNIILSGGNTMFPGIAKRLMHEILDLFMDTSPGNFRILFHEAHHEIYSAWIGGAILLGLPSLSWIGKRNYEEIGSNIVHRMCF